MFAKYTPPLAASPVQSKTPPGRQVPEPRGPPRPHEPPALHLRGGPASLQKEEHVVRRRQDADEALRAALNSTPLLLAARAATSRSELQAVGSRIKRRPGASWKPLVCACCAWAVCTTWGLVPEGLRGPRLRMPLTLSPVSRQQLPPTRLPQLAPCVQLAAMRLLWTALPPRPTLKPLALSRSPGRCAVSRET